jgi:hypothetical protein
VWSSKERSTRPRHCLQRLEVREAIGTRYPLTRWVPALNGDDGDGAVDVMEMLPLRQGGVSGVDGGDFPPAAAADQPPRRRKKGSTSAAVSENYRKIRASFFLDTESSIRIRRRGDHRGPNGPGWRGLARVGAPPCLV